MNFPEEDSIPNFLPPATPRFFDEVIIVNCSLKRSCHLESTSPVESVELLSTTISSISLEVSINCRKENRSLSRNAAPLYDMMIIDNA